MSQDDETARRLEFLWRDDERPRSGPGPKPGLSTERIVRAAIEIADGEGLDGVSMQRVAKRLDVTAMSLYRYVPSKDDLVDAMMDTASGEPPDLAGLPGWRDRVEGWVKGLWARYQAHPWMLRVRLGNPIGPNQLAWFEALLHSISDIGLSHDEMISVNLFVSGATQGLAKISVDTAPGPADAGGMTYDQALTKVVDAERFPTLSALLAAGTFTAPERVPEPTDAYVVPNLEFGLRQMLAGIEDYVAERRRNRGE
ncbi:TetR/AcrR family transcriptional regulator [Actinophytocola gossypii]|uniref:TetR/AcrR family transcriptional regulator n=1 Tax=Actinophytocola gossypii TaxID=2812003 RepID=A0ABT2JBA2_9PSEU|nr:TetR/AcrR family transcriptional regulator [Actinophytocola gossypii]MCT2585141.1 TetR/AcrR family transcriptional regulator [Actinophytocola gossypii]